MLPTSSRRKQIAFLRRAVVTISLALTVVGCATRSVEQSPLQTTSDPDATRIIELRTKYGVSLDKPTSQRTLLNQIFADDDVDPFSAESLRLKRLALQPGFVQDRPSETADCEPIGTEGSAIFSARFQTALQNLERSHSFNLLYRNKIEALLAKPRTTIRFNQCGINCGGPVCLGTFETEIVGIVLWLDLSSDVMILTTRGIRKATAERIIAHELIDAIAPIVSPAQFSMPDAGLMYMDTVLQANKIMGELYRSGAISKEESAARIRYWR